ncbi:helix-turn-helix domain-containing protein [Micromonospora sp. NPDC051141]|uniref:helix-turn-helix transcriptional regulator n=1 Tax=Micromonospora sp. NPDC051141 TaxID=3364284 RepID=UPI0037ACF01E
MSPSPPSGPRQLGPLLAELRAARGWSQQRIAAELCAAAGVPTLTRHEVSRWERQLRLPGDFWSVWLARVLGVPGELITEAAARSRRLRRGPAGGRPEPATSSTDATGATGRLPEPATSSTGATGATGHLPEPATGPAGVTDATGHLPEPATRPAGVTDATGHLPEPATGPAGATDATGRPGPDRAGNPAAGPPPGPGPTGASDATDAADAAGRPARARGGTRAAGHPGRRSGARRGRPRPPARTGRPPQPGGPGTGRARAVPRRTARRGGDEAGPAGTD